MKELIESITQSHPYLSVRVSIDCPAFDCPQQHLLAVLEALRDSHGMDLLTDVTGVDHFDTEPRFEVVYHLYSTQNHHYLRLTTPCKGQDEPLCPSVTSLWPAADWHEREAYDMFGIFFEGHPDLRRILMWEGYPYHPLRKEFPLAGKEVEFPSADLTEATGARVLPAPMMGGPFHASQHGPMSKREPRADDESWTETRQRQAPANSETNKVPRELNRGKQ